MAQKFVLFGLTLMCCVVSVKVETNDGLLTTPQLIEKFGYDSEIHKVVTPDGYILEMHRMTGRKSRRTFENGVQKPVIFLVHGLGSSSAQWIFFGPTRSLGFVLADAGFDVWLGNTRGVRYSMAHTFLNNNQKEYWEFSWHEIGYYDLPAMIDYILQITRQKKLNYIGFSEGGTAFYVMASLRPEYNSKISLAQSLVGPAFMERSIFPFVYNQYSRRIEMISRVFGKYNLESEYSIPTALGGELFMANRNNPLFVALVAYLVKTLEFDVDIDDLATVMGHYPVGGSLKEVYHYTQLVHNKRFCQYDHGFVKNLEVYGRPTPPDYDLKKISTPVILFYGLRDQFSPSPNTIKLAKILPSVKTYPMEDYGHFDFIAKKKLRPILFKSIVENAKTYSRL